MTSQGTSILLYAISLFPALPFGSTEFTLIAIIGLLYIFRIIGAVRGEKYSKRRLYLLPTFYLLIMVLTFYTTSTYVILGAVLLILLGLGAGYAISKRASVFEKKGKMFFKRSMAVTSLWTAMFAVNILTPLYYPQYDYPVYFSVFLTFLTGMIWGQVLRLSVEHAVFNKEGPGNEIKGEETR